MTDMVEAYNHVIENIGSTVRIRQRVLKYLLEHGAHPRGLFIIVDYVPNKEENKFQFNLRVKRGTKTLLYLWGDDEATLLSDTNLLLLLILYKS